jgi:molecular chaperone DnaK (HSP70)
MAARFFVGVDLGTTNSALAFVDAAGKNRKVRDFLIPQLVGPADVAARPTLPSVHHHVGEHELSQHSTRLPWTPMDAPSPDFVVGEFARTQSVLVPGRTVFSAKSWLCHPRVDRLAAILPWGGAADVPKLSPVEVSSRYLSHMVTAFGHAHGATPTEMEVTLAVPASFDEVARELTVEAARRAGIPLSQLSLLEEPQAAFYHWLSQHARFAEEVEVGDVVLVCDIGGGTTDFTLISVQKTAARSGKKLSFTRTAVGEHLLLGGDNMDLLLARRVEQQLGGQRLSPHTFAGLLQACRVAKEKLLGEEPPERFSIHVAGRGSRLIGGGLHSELLRSDVEQAVLDGFFPRVKADAEPGRSRSGLQEFGLPYVADAAMTRHVAAFLRQHKAHPTVVLFNGGVMSAPSIRERILDVLKEIGGERPRLLSSESLDLAVARGAAYSGLSRSGEGLRILGGAARAYYVEAGSAQDQAVSQVCLLPRGMEEGSEQELPSVRMLLLLNQPVRFRLFSSVLREGDAPGQVLKLDPSEATELPPLYTVLRHPKTSQQRPVTVTLAARLTEIGTLELWAVATEKDAEGGTLKWRLQFDLRQTEVPTDGENKTETSDSDSEDDEQHSGPKAAEAGLLQAAAEHIHATFAQSASPAALPKALSQVLGPKENWSTPTLRALWEELKKARDHRTKSAAHEARWLNLVGFVLRPGFGFPLDDWRVKEAWRAWNAGLHHEKDDACRLEWWILWRRISGGLSRNQQEEIWKRAAPLFVPSLRRPDRKAPGPHEHAELCRMLSSCERLDVKKKTELGDAVLAVLEKRRTEFALWSIGRIGGRLPLYGPHDTVVSHGLAEKWAQRLMKLPVDKTSHADERYQVAHAVTELCRLTGDRAIDVSATVRQTVSEWIAESLPNAEGGPLLRSLKEVVPREEKAERFVFGDTLPTGLRLLPSGQ